MRQRQRRNFAAPFILTLAAAIPACTKGSPTVKEPKPDPVASPYQTWSVERSGEACSVYYEMDCPPDASCNPPPPMAVACPAGVEDGARFTIVQLEEDGPCSIGEEPAECPSYE